MPSENNLAKRLYRNNSLPRLDASLLPTNPSLIASITLKKCTSLQKTKPLLQFSKGKLRLRRMEQPSLLLNTSKEQLKKRPRRKFQRRDYINESILPAQLKPDYQRKLQRDKKLSPLKDSPLTPQDFIQLINEDIHIKNQFCYLKKNRHMYDLQVFTPTAYPQEYTTISKNGITYFSYGQSRFVSLEEWRKQAHYFNIIIKLDFFGKYKLLKNFSNWKKYSRKILMKKTKQTLEKQLLLNDRHLLLALLKSRALAYSLQSQAIYCRFQENSQAMKFQAFRVQQDREIGQKFQRRIKCCEEDIQLVLTHSLSQSMRCFKEENKMSGGQCLLAGDEKNLDMKYTKEATLRIQQDRFKRFLKLIDLLMVHSKIQLMAESTGKLVWQIAEENEMKEKNRKTRQFIKCIIQVQNNSIEIVPTRSQIITLFQSIVLKSTSLLALNHKSLFSNASLCKLISTPQHSPDSYSLQNVINSQELKYASMVSSALHTSYNTLQEYTSIFAPYFRNYTSNLNILQCIPNDIYTLRQHIENWKQQLEQVNKINEEHQSPVFLLDCVQFKGLIASCIVECLSKMREVLPPMYELTTKTVRRELKHSLQLMDMSPVGVEPYIQYQSNKRSIELLFERMEQRMLQLGCMYDVIRGLANEDMKESKEKKELLQLIKVLKNKLEESEIHARGHELFAQEEVKRMIPMFNGRILTLYGQTRKVCSTQHMQVLQYSKRQFSALMQEYHLIQSYYTALQMEQFYSEGIVQFAGYFSLFSRVWELCSGIGQYTGQMLESNISGILIQNQLGRVQQFMSAHAVLKKELVKGQGQYTWGKEEEGEIERVLRDLTEQVRPMLEILRCIRDASFEEKEWKMLRRELERKNKEKLYVVMHQCREMKLKGLRQCVGELELVRSILLKSKKQAQINSKINMVSKIWSNEGSNTAKNLLENFKEEYWRLASEIDEGLVLINGVKEEVEEGQLKTKIQSEKVLFDSLGGLLWEWKVHDQYLTFLEPVFVHPYWKGTAESKAFSCAESNWKKLLKQMSKDVSLRKLAGQEKKISVVFEENNAVFRHLHQQIQRMLQHKRQIFNRFYFLSNQALLSFLLEVRDLSHEGIIGMFPHLSTIQLNTQKTIPLSVTNASKEVLVFKFGVSRWTDIDEGLKLLEEKVREGVRSSLNKCIQQYEKDQFNRGKWIKQNHFQCLLFCSNVALIKLIECDYLEGQDYNELLSFQYAQNKELVKMMKEQCQGIAKLQPLLVQGLHFRDVIGKLKECNVRDEHSFEWVSQVRSYYSNESVCTKYMDCSVEYGFQFVCPRNQSYYFTEKQIIQLVSSMYSQELLSSDVARQFAVLNALNYVAVPLTPHLQSSYLLNVCQGAYLSATVLCLEQQSNINVEQYGVITSFIREHTQKNHCSGPFITMKGGKLDKNAFRVIAPVKCAVSMQLEIIFEVMQWGKGDFPMSVERAICNIRECGGYSLLPADRINKIAIQMKNKTKHQQQFKALFCREVYKQIAMTVVQKEQINCYIRIFKQIVEKQVQQVKKCKQSCQSLSDILCKTNAYALLGPYKSGKRQLVQKQARERGIHLHSICTDCTNPDTMFGFYDDSLWKQGILIKLLKSAQQVRWLLLEGTNMALILPLAHAFMQSRLQLPNGDIQPIPANWKLLITSEDLDVADELPCPKHFAQKFVSFQEKIIQMLEQHIRRFFSEQYSMVRNWCLNNLQKCQKMRVKTESQAVLNGFQMLLASALTHTPTFDPKSLQKILHWCLYWSVATLLPMNDSSTKALLDTSFSDRIDVNVSVSVLKAGVMQRVSQPHFSELYFINGYNEVKINIIEQLMACNYAVYLYGGSGKSVFLRYLINYLPEECVCSCLYIPANECMSMRDIHKMLFRKVKLSNLSNRSKVMESVNGKKIIIMVDNFNLILKNSELYNFIKECIVKKMYVSEGEVIQLKDIMFVLAQTSSHQSIDDEHLLSYMKHLHFDEFDLDSIVERMRGTQREGKQMGQIVVNVCAIHKMMKEKTAVSMSIPFRIIEWVGMSRGNKFVNWALLTHIEYAGVYRGDLSKIANEIKNRLELAVKGQQPQDNILVEELRRQFPCIQRDAQYQLYYQYLQFLLKETNARILFTVREPLSKRTKQKILKYLSNAVKINCTVISDSDSQFINSIRGIAEQVVNNVGRRNVNANNKRQLYCVDVRDEKELKSIFDKFPSLVHQGVVFQKQIHSIDNKFSQSIGQFKKKWQTIEQKQVLEYQIVQIHELVQEYYQKIKNIISNKLSYKKQIIAKHNAFKQKTQLLCLQIQNQSKQLSALISKQTTLRCALSQAKKQQRVQLQSNCTQIAVLRSAMQQSLSLKKRSFGEMQNALLLVIYISSKEQQMITILQMLQTNQIYLSVLLSWLLYFTPSDLSLEQLMSASSIRIEEVMLQLYGFSTRTVQGIVWLLQGKSKVFHSCTSTLGMTVVRSVGELKAVVGESNCEEETAIGMVVSQLEEEEESEGEDRIRLVKNNQVYQIRGDGKISFRIENQLVREVRIQGVRRDLFRISIVKQQIREFNILEIIEEILGELEREKTAIIRGITGEIGKMEEIFRNIEQEIQRNIIKDEIIVVHKKKDLFETILNNVNILREKRQIVEKQRQQKYNKVIKRAQQLYCYTKYLLNLVSGFRMQKQRFKRQILTAITSSTFEQKCQEEIVIRLDSQKAQSLLNKSILCYVLTCLDNITGVYAYAIYAFLYTNHKESNLDQNTLLVFFTKLIQKNRIVDNPFNIKSQFLSTLILNSNSIMKMDFDSLHYECKSNIQSLSKSLLIIGKPQYIQAEYGAPNREGQIRDSLLNIDILKKDSFKRVRKQNSIWLYSSWEVYERCSFKRQLEALPCVSVSEPYLHRRIQPYYPYTQSNEIDRLLYSIYSYEIGQMVLRRGKLAVTTVCRRMFKQWKIKQVSELVKALKMLEMQKQEQCWEIDKNIHQKHQLKKYVSVNQVMQIISTALPLEKNKVLRDSFYKRIQWTEVQEQSLPLKMYQCPKLLVVQSKRSFKLDKNLLFETAIRQYLQFKQNQNINKKIQKQCHKCLSTKSNEIQRHSLKMNRTNQRLLATLQYLQELYFKENLLTLDPSRVPNPMKLVARYIFSERSQGELTCRVLSEKEYEGVEQKAVCLVGCELREAKFDIVKNCLEVKGDNHKVNRVVLAVFEPCGAGYMTIDLKCRGKKIIRVEIPTKIREWKEVPYLQCG